MNKRSIVVYVAGPFRAPDSWQMERNVRHAEELALEIWRAGFTALCPHTNTRFYQGALPDDAWLEGDLALLSRCDAVLLTPNWRCSQGATRERQHAICKSIPVFGSMNDLCSHFQ